jgi:hypothetical protein
MLRFEFEFETFPWFSYITFVRMENHICLSRGVQVTGATCWTPTRIMAGVGDLVQKTKDGQAQVGYSVAGRLKGRVTSCVVCTVHAETTSTSFLVEPQNQGRVSWFSLKTKVDDSSRFGLKTTRSGFSVWALKSIATVW